jgi:signal transduction histidine kinase
MEKEEQEALFEKFVRGKAGKASEGGSGLGLFLAKKIVEAHGGTIAVHSEGLSKGSVFIVRIPIKNT